MLIASCIWARRASGRSWRRGRGAFRLTRPIQAVEVPATVQVILAARIDRLSAEDKQLLQTAAVIGNEAHGIGRRDVKIKRYLEDR